MILQRTIAAVCAWMLSAGVETARGDVEVFPPCVDVKLDANVQARRLVASHVQRELAALLSAGPGPCAQLHIRETPAHGLHIALAYDGRTLVTELPALAEDGPHYARVAGLTAAALLRQLPFASREESQPSVTPPPAVAPEAPPATISDRGPVSADLLPSPPQSETSVGPVQPLAVSASPPERHDRLLEPWRRWDALVRMGAVLSLPHITPLASAEMGVGFAPFPEMPALPRVELTATGHYARTHAGTTTARLWAEGATIALTLRPLKTKRSALHLGGHLRVLAAQLRGTHAGEQTSHRSWHAVASAGVRAELAYTLSAHASALVALDGGYVVTPLRVRAGTEPAMDYAGALAAASLGLRLR